MHHLLRTHIYGTEFKRKMIIGLLLAVIVLGSSFFIVDETEQTVITRFGKYYRTAGPGLQFKLPLGIDKCYSVPVKVIQTEQFGFKTVKSGRENEYRNNICFLALFFDSLLSLVLVVLRAELMASTAFDTSLSNEWLMRCVL